MNLKNNEQESIAIYLKKAKDMGLDMKKNDILFLISFMQSVIDKSISDYKKSV